MEFSQLEDTLRTRYPDDADQYLIVIDRWLWWSGGNARFDSGEPHCAVCFRSDIRTLTFCARPDDPWDPRTPFGLCGPCVGALCELGDVPLTDQQVLEALEGALDPGTFAELEKLAEAARPFAPEPAQSRCHDCMEAVPPLWQVERGTTIVCSSCCQRVFDDGCAIERPTSDAAHRIIDRRFALAPEIPPELL